MNQSSSVESAKPKFTKQNAPGAKLWYSSAALVLLLLATLVFRDFLFGEKVLLYKDIGSDSLNDYFPCFVHLSDYLRHTGLPSWSFSVGMGQSIYYLIGYLVLDPVTWLPKNAIPQALVFQHLLKVLVAGLLFLRFLRLRNLAWPAAVTGAVLFALSAYLCLGACWIVLADEALCFAAILAALEEAVTRRKWIYLPFAVALISLVTVFHLYLCALLLSLYLPARLIELHTWKPAPLVRTCALLAVASLLGLGLAAVIFFPNTYLIFHSTRLSKLVESNWPDPSLLQFGTVSYYFTAALRWFANDLLGTGSDFRGWQNYLEAPLVYCGLLPLLILPQVFVGLSARRRLLYSVLLLLIVIPTILPWFRYLFWLFQGGYFRTFSLFSIVAVIALSMETFSRYTRDGSFNLWVLSLTLVLLVGVLWLPLREMQNLIGPRVRLTVIGFLGIYFCILVAGQLFKRQSAAAWLVAGMVMAELVFFDYVTVSNHPTVAKGELSQEVGYNDETAVVLQRLQAEDHGLYRVTKTWASSPAEDTSLNDAMVFNYFGTSSYSSFNSLNHLTFLLSVDAIKKNHAPAAALWSYGLLGHPLLSTFACEKYVLVKPPATLKSFTFYEPVNRYAEVQVLRNQWGLPFGVAFDHTLTDESFTSLSSTEKAEALFRVVVLPEGHRSDTESLGVLELRQQISREPLVAAVADRQSQALRPTLFSQTQVEGTIDLKHPSILVFQMPFDAGWHVSVDGHATQAFIVDSGLLGVSIESGRHQVKMRYRPPLLYLGAATSLVAFAVLLFAWWRWPVLSAFEDE